MASNANRSLRRAAGRGDVAGITAALLAGADPNAFERDNAWTPLMAVAASGHIAAIAALLAAGARVNGADRSCETPLIRAVLHGRTSAVNTLLVAGADVNHASKNGYTALHCASMDGHLDAARALLDAGARTDVGNKEGKRPIDLVRALVRGGCVIASRCCPPALPCAGLHGICCGQVQRGRTARAAHIRHPLVPPPPCRRRLLRGRVGVGGVSGVGGGRAAPGGHKGGE
jgi:hypothetical protein